MKVYLARHGETTANERGIVLGQTDAPLVPSGRDCTRRLAHWLQDQGIQTILVSSLGRAVESARILAEEIGGVPVPVAELMELSCGRWEGLLRGETGSGGTLRSTWTHRPPGGESCQDAEPRVLKIIHTILELPAGSSTLVVGHAAVNRVFLKLWHHLDPSLANLIAQPHDLIYILERELPVRWIRADGKSGSGWRL